MLVHIEQKLLLGLKLSHCCGLVVGLGVDMLLGFVPGGVTGHSK